MMMSKSKRPLNFSVRLLVLILGASTRQTIGQETAPVSPHGPTKQTEAERFAQRVIELTNVERKNVGLAPLRRNDQLAAAAEKHAEDMAKNHYFEHRDRRGREPWDRVREEGYDYRSCGENIAAGARTPEQVVKMWLKSPGHRRNLLGSFEEIGVGFARSGSKSRTGYWVQVFATPAG